MAIAGCEFKHVHVGMNTARKFVSTFLLLTASASAISAQTYAFQLDPQQSHASFTRGDVLHTVHGTFQMKSGSVRFDTTTGAATVLIVIDATSSDTGNRARDHKMHKEILESDKFPEITFAPQQVRGQVLAEGKSQVTMDGLMTLHGQGHPNGNPRTGRSHSGSASTDPTFIVPYVQWGLKNPSTFMLKVSGKVDIDVHAVGHLDLHSIGVPSRAVRSADSDCSWTTATNRLSRGPQVMPAVS